MRDRARRRARSRSRAITLKLDRSCDRVCNIPAPTDGLEAKFSLRQTVAMALAGVDTASLAAYSAATANDPASDGIAREGRCSTSRTAGRKPPPRSRSTLTDGRVLRASHDAGVPSADIAAQGERLAAKFDALAEPVLGAARARELRRAIEGLDTLADAGEIGRLAAK